MASGAGQEAAQAQADATALAPATLPPARTTATSLGAATTRQVWTHEVTDLAKVPRQYLMVNEAAIRAVYTNPVAKAMLAKGGEQPIPGVRIFQKDGLAVGAKR